ncbi:hypothetical protein tb265_48020 [Gemmatimonadetes bacterium T265]|nr:hypothetical protein tb265_48020 [Gemmatimonadetes bacterium T265]
MRAAVLVLAAAGAARGTADTARCAPQVGRAARRLLSDSLAATPGHLRRWAVALSDAAVRLAPRLAAALLTFVVCYAGAVEALDSLGLNLGRRARARPRLPL